ncbi:MAG: NFACT RNA binding domain-containing protein [Candidatus Pacearchaeota archaeon]|jgi:predicted ribosome quality control (RQC) complex YloA/Tae2 family protein
MAEKIKFREIKLVSGSEFILGRDEKSNDELMKKYKGKENIILHTRAPGSPFCVIKTKIFDGDVNAAAVLCARYSQDWRNNKKNVAVNVFTGKDISKEKGMKAGTWNVKKFTTIIVKKEEILKVLK